MDEMFTRDKKPSRRVEPANETKQKTYGKKLKNELSRSEAMRSKFRTGKADTKETIAEKKKSAKVHKQGKKHAKAQAIANSRVRNVAASQNEDQSAGYDAINSGVTLAEGALYSAKAKSHSKGKDGYGKKLHKKKYTEEAKKASAAKEASAETSKQVQKNLMKKEIQNHAYRAQAKETANAAGSFSKRFVDKAEDLVGRLAENITEFLVNFVKDHPLFSVVAVLILIVVLVVCGCFTSCSMMASGGGNVTLETSYTAQDPDILDVNDNYLELENELQEKVDNIESDYPGYDEYRYNLAEISHNPFELAALLTVLYEDYTPSEANARLQEIMDSQYELTTEEEVEIRTRTVTVTDPETGEETEVEEEYEYYILKVVLTNKSVGGVAQNFGLTDDQYARYLVLCETYGNKRYLFEGDPYAVRTPGEDYEVPLEYLTDEQFGNMLHEAEKYLNMAYVWGGSSPETGFDCSGFVSWVINHSSNGWNVGRQGANSLYENVCTPVSPSEAKPGDLIFFKHTYEAAGEKCSHVGIYVGDGMMIHCGDPIKYSSVNTSYWQEHFFSYGRINQ